jgi:serralysin
LDAGEEQGFQGSFAYTYDPGTGEVLSVEGSVESISYSWWYHDYETIPETYYSGGWNINNTYVDVADFQTLGNDAIAAIIFQYEDTIDGSSGADTLKGFAGDDYIRARDGSDTLDGGLGEDLMLGGTGDDTYFVDTGRDVIIEYANEGNDTVVASIGHTLRQAVENLFLLGSDDVNGVGNTQNNKILGNLGNNTLRGLDGDDELDGGNGDDTLIGGLGADRLIGGASTDTAYYVGASAGLTASLGNAPLNTGDALGDTYSSIENLTGSNFDDKLNGNNQVNIIRGGSGDDTIKGYGGSDTLIGGSGKDYYIFNTALNGATNVDKLSGWEASIDAIWLDDAIFTQISQPIGKMLSGYFKNINTGAIDANDRIIYDKANGDVYYDADGSGGISAIRFADLPNNAALSYQDFSII